MDISIGTFLSASESHEWDQFVASQARGSVCHLSGYARTLADVFSYPPLFCVAKSGDRIVGVWPFSLAGTYLKKLVSMPFLEMGGPLVSDDAGNEVISLLAGSVVDFATSRGVTWIESRCALGLGPHAPANLFVAKAQWDYAALELEKDPDVLFNRRLNHSVRKAIRKAERSGLSVRMDDGTQSIESIFYPLYLQYMKRRHGSPPLPLKWFSGLAESIRPRLKVFYVEHEGAVLAALLGFAVGQRVYVSHAPTAEIGQDLRPSDYAHWAFVKWACENGFRYFDFGNARYKGQRDFKAKWGCSFSTYHRYYLPMRQGFHAPEPPNIEGRAYQAASRLWRWGMPLPLTPIVGQWIHRWLVE